MSHEAFLRDCEAREAAVDKSRFKGPAARTLVLCGNNDAEFQAALKQAESMRSIAGLSRGTLESMGIDVDMAIERSIVNRISLKEVKSIIIQRLAENDEATHTDSTPYRACPDDIYASRREQMLGAK